MDANSFDDLTRGVIARRTRRATLGALIATVAGTIVGGSALTRAQERVADADGERTGPVGSKRKCRGDKRRCSGKCVDVDTNAKNCGRCGNRCGADERCRGGECGAVTSPGPGGCQGNSCGNNETCVQGECCRTAFVCNGNNGQRTCCDDFNQCIDGACCEGLACFEGPSPQCCASDQGCYPSGCCTAANFCASTNTCCLPNQTCELQGCVNIS